MSAITAADINQGHERYPEYYYLWHLIAIGAISAEAPDIGDVCPKSIQGVVWTDPAFSPQRPSAKIAMIDMGVAPHHPNLDPDSAPGSRIDWANAIDLASHRYGAKDSDFAAQPMHSETRGRHLSAVSWRVLSSSATTGANPVELDIDAEQVATLERLRNGQGVFRYVGAYGSRYSTHGTCCAGLAVGTTDENAPHGSVGDTIVYYGVDPESIILPITTSISPDPEQLVAAFLYAHAQDADVILFPRDAGFPEKAPFYNQLDANEKTRFDGTEEAKKWDLFEKVFLAVSKDIPIVCAAGNDGLDDLIYPARLAADTANGVIAIGAVSYRGFRSGYSNYGDGLTAVAPSDDGEVYNRYQIRLDEQSPSVLDYFVKDVNIEPAPPTKVIYSPQRLVTLDVPGPRGYADGNRETPPKTKQEAMLDAGALYTQFGGTSGASSIVAGVVALMQRQSATRIGGPAIKQRLMNPGGSTPNLDISGWYWLDPAHPGVLEVDGINGPDAPAEVMQFGSGGLINLRKLLNLP